MHSQDLQPGERLDICLPVNKKIFQKENGFKVSQESVILAGFARNYARGKILDLGTGNGILLFMLSGEKDLDKMVGIDINVPVLGMARRSAQLNSIEQRIHYVAGDIKTVPLLFRERSFDTVITNPPYYKLKTGRLSPNHERAHACHELTCTLPDVLRAASRVLVSKGRFIIIYLSARLSELIQGMEQHKLTPKIMQFIHSYHDRPAKHVLICARKDAASGMEVLPPHVVYKKHNEYTAEMERYYAGSKRIEHNADKDNIKE